MAHIDNFQNNDRTNATVTEIGAEFVGAPEQVSITSVHFNQKKLIVGGGFAGTNLSILLIFPYYFQVNQINVKFAKTAKVVDMKQLKLCCLNIIRKDCAQSAKKTDLPKRSVTLQEEYSDGASSFYQIYKELPQKLTKNMKEALSPAVAFYSILHLANDNCLRLIKDDEHGFIIRQIKC